MSTIVKIFVHKELLVVPANTIDIRLWMCSVKALFGIRTWGRELQSGDYREETNEDGHSLLQQDVCTHVIKSACTNDYKLSDVFHVIFTNKKTIQCNS